MSHICRGPAANDGLPMRPFAFAATPDVRSGSMSADRPGLNADLQFKP